MLANQAGYKLGVRNENTFHTLCLQSPVMPLLGSVLSIEIYMGGRRSPAVACWASDHWVASSNQLRGKFRHYFRLIIPGVCLAQFSLNNVHKRGLKHHHFIISIEIYDYHITSFFFATFICHPNTGESLCHYQTMEHDIDVSCTIFVTNSKLLCDRISLFSTLLMNSISRFISTRIASLCLVLDEIRSTWATRASFSAELRDRSAVKSMYMYSVCTCTVLPT